jgi:hypothetical protein
MTVRGNATGILQDAGKAPKAMEELELRSSVASRTGPSGPPLRGREAVLDPSEDRSKLAAMA